MTAPDWLLHIHPGAAAVVRFATPWHPHSEMGHWTNEEQGRWAFVSCAMIDCAWCLKGDRPQVRYTVRVVTQDGAEKDLYCTLPAYKLILDRRERDAHFHANLYEIERPIDIAHGGAWFVTKV